MRTLRDPLLIVIMLLSFVLASSTLTRGQDWGDDFASYIMQAQSIVDGDTQNFVEHNSFTISESSANIGPIAYPWGYPLLLAPAYTFKGVHPLWLKLPTLIFYMGFLLCLFYLTKPRFTRTESLLLVSLFAFNPMLIQYLDYILSDIPFLFFSTLALLLFVNNVKRKTLDYILLGSVIASAFFIRTQGLLLLLSYIGLKFIEVWLHRTNREITSKIIRDALFVLGGFGILWAVYALVFPGGSESYFAQYEAFQINTALKFINSYFQVFSQFFGEGTSWTYLYYVLLIFFLIGAWTRRKEETVFIIYLVIWMLFLVTWPYWQGSRFIFPLLPIFMYFTFWGMKTVIARLSPSHRRAGMTTFYVFWITVSALFLFTSGRNAYINIRDNRDIAGPFDIYSDEMFNFIKVNTSPESVVVFFKPRAMRLFTNRDSIMVLECERLKLGAYISIHKKWDNSQILPAAVDECGIPMKSVFENRRFIVYEVLK